MNDITTTPAQVQSMLDDLEASVAASMVPLRDQRRDDGSAEGLGSIEPPD